MNDIVLLRRSILWDLEWNDFSAVPSNSNSYQVGLALDAAYRKFVFICAEHEDRELVRAQAAQLLEDMLEPAAMKLDSDSYHSPSTIISRELKEIAARYPVESAVAAASPRW